MNAQLQHNVCGRGIVRLGRCIAFMIIVFIPLYAQGGSSTLWSISSNVSSTPGITTRFVPLHHLRLTANMPELRRVLFAAPLERAGLVQRSTSVLELPMPDSAFGRFRIVESPIMEAGLAAKFPEIHTYIGQGIDDPAASARLDITPAGFHALILSPNGSIYIDPESRNDSGHYVSYYRRDLYREGAGLLQSWTCTLISEPLIAAQIRQLVESGILAPSGSQRREYRLACAATGEYTEYFGGTVSQGMAAIVTAINRVTGIYENEVAIRLILVANNDQLVYTKLSKDPYTNNNPSRLITQNQSNVDDVIGDANYDIGHVFSTAGGGLAGLGVVCRSNYKAWGETGLPSPVGDAFYVDYVAHEMGHQFGANHSFNGTSGSCSGANRNASTAYEPGSGSTIMSYAGICSPQDLQLHSDPYFHSISFEEIVAYSTEGPGNCPAPISTGNLPPSVDAGSGGYIIPISTPFALTGSASDPDGDPLTYCWEEFDLGPAGDPESPSGSAPILRSFNPVSSPTRIFPRLADLLNSSHTIGELLPAYARTLTFRLTARDNRGGGGGVNYASISCTVSAAAGPFAVTAPNTAVSWPAGTQQTVSWNVANTNATPVNCSAVNILLSTNGGQTFPITLASSTPNDGSELVTVPDNRTSTARIRVEAAGNIFFDVSDVDFIVDAPVPVQLATFTGRLTGNHDVLLEWTTLSEVNNYGFEVQNSTESTGKFQTVPRSFISGHGTTLVPQKYSFIDHPVNSEIRNYRLKQIDLDGAIHYCEAIGIGTTTEVAREIPARFELLQNYSNPFNPSTIIGYHLPAISQVKLQVYDLLGREVATLVDGAEGPGLKSVRFDASHLPGGVYFYRLQASQISMQGGDYVMTRKLTLVK